MSVVSSSSFGKKGKKLEKKNDKLRILSSQVQKGDFVVCFFYSNCFISSFWTTLWPTSISFLVFAALFEFERGSWVLHEQSLWRCWLSFSGHSDFADTVTKILSRILVHFNRHWWDYAVSPITLMLNQQSLSDGAFRELAVSPTALTMLFQTLSV